LLCVAAAACGLCLRGVPSKQALRCVSRAGRRFCSQYSLAG